MNLLRKILFPFSILYGGITALRNYLYNKGWLKSTSYDLPIICVGNLTTGGTGKSPMIQYLIELLKDKYTIGVLSRGYKRKTKGYLEVLTTSTAEEVGDEPLQFKENFPEVTIAVCADRRKGIEILKKKVNVILLDDAFQHRKVKASTYILLTPFNDLYNKDFMLPTGNLREPREGAKRADVIIVTKCPEGVAYSKMQEIQYDLNIKPHQKIYFSKIGYDDLIYSASETLQLDYLNDKPFTLVTGIANPKPLVEFLEKKDFVFTHEKYPDHHDFSSSEIKKLKGREIILTTEKDYMRLQPKLNKYALYYLPIKTIILRDQEEFLNNTIIEAVENNLYH
jgi:tetraacyldisaccharide 4'-kinase